MLHFHSFLWPIKSAASAHDRAFRLWDNQTPYAMHPIWCAMMLLSETLLPEEIRFDGYVALCLHDVLEDTDEKLPDWVPSRCVILIEEMTFASSAEEFEKIWDRSDECILLKLYDKVSNLLDGAWMSDEKWSDYCDLVFQLVNFVEHKYGNLNITKIARAIAKRR